MSLFDKIKSMTIDEFVSWIMKVNTNYKDTFLDWWDHKYCIDCETTEVDDPSWYHPCRVSQCELNGECKYFTRADHPEMYLDDDDYMPSYDAIIKQYLQQEINE